MKISVRFPIILQTDEPDDVFAQKQAFLNAFQFDPEEVAQQQCAVNQNLELVDFVRLNRQETYFYSPLFTGRNLTIEDEEVCFAYFEYKHSQYKQSPDQYYSPKERNAYKKNNSLPTYMPWEILEQYFDSYMRGPHTQQHFERWLALQQKTAITAEIKNETINKSPPRKI